MYARGVSQPVEAVLCDTLNLAVRRAHALSLRLHVATGPLLYEKTFQSFVSDQWNYAQMALLLSANAPAGVLRAAAGKYDEPPPIAIDVACTGGMLKMGEIYYSELLQIAVEKGECKMDIRAQGTPAPSLSSPEAPPRGSVGAFTCTHDSIIVGPRSELLSTVKDVESLETCKTHCIEESSDKCTAFVHNKYQECHLLSGDATKLGLSTDDPTHGSIACRSALLALTPFRPANERTKASAAIDELVASAEKRHKSTVHQKPCFMSAADSFHDCYAKVLEPLLQEGSPAVSECKVGDDGTVEGALWLLLIGDLTSPAAATRLGERAAGRLAEKHVLVNAIDQLAPLISRGGTAYLLHSLLGDAAWELTPRTATIPIGDNSNPHTAHRFSALDVLKQSALWPTLGRNSSYIFKTSIAAAAFGLALWTSPPQGMNAPEHMRRIYSATRLLYAIPQQMGCSAPQGWMQAPRAGRALAYLPNHTPSKGSSTKWASTKKTAAMKGAAASGRRLDALPRSPMRYQQIQRRGPSSGGMNRSWDSSYSQARGISNSDWRGGKTLKQQAQSRWTLNQPAQSRLSERASSRSMSSTSSTSSTSGGARITNVRGMRAIIPPKGPKPKAAPSCPDEVVIQPLITEPLLFEGRKLNVRSITLILPGNPAVSSPAGRRARLFHDYGQWMVATHKLEDGADSKGAQIVNTASRVNKHVDTEGFLAPPAPGAGRASLKRLAEFIAREPSALSEQGWARLMSVSVSQGKLRHAAKRSGGGGTGNALSGTLSADEVEEALQALWASTTGELLNALCPLVSGARAGQFALLGADYLLDRHAKLWLIEFNPFPVMPLGSEGRSAMFADKMRDVLALLRAWRRGAAFPAADDLTEFVESAASAESHRRCTRSRAIKAPLHAAPGQAPAAASPAGAGAGRVVAEASSWPVSSRCRGQPEEHRVAVGLYGHARTLHTALPTLHGKVLSPLAAACVEVDVFVHTSVAKKEDVAATREQLQSALRPLKLEVQLPGNDKTPLKPIIALGEKVRTQPAGNCKWIRNYKPQQLSGLVHSLSALDALTTLWESFRASKPHTYTAVLITRLDVQYITSLDVPALLRVAPREVHVPYHASFDGVNDRLAFGTPEAMRSYGHRLKHARAFVTAGHRLHGDEFLAYALRKEELLVRNATLLSQNLRQDMHSDGHVVSRKRKAQGDPPPVLGGSALARPVWYDACFAKPECVHGCKYDCSGAYEMWPGWADCKQR